MPSAARRLAQLSNADRIDAVEAYIEKLERRIAGLEARTVGLEPRPAIDDAARRRAADEAARAADTIRFQQQAVELAAERLAQNATAFAKQNAESAAQADRMRPKLAEMATFTAAQHAKARAYADMFGKPIKAPKRPALPPPASPFSPDAYSDAGSVGR